MYNAKQHITGVVFKSLVFVLMLIGVFFPTGRGGNFMSSNLLLFFTIQSNIVCGVVCAVFLVFDIIAIVRKRPLVIAPWLYVVKLAATVGVTLTLIVFWAMLMPTMVVSNPWYLLTPSNLCCHTFVPIFAILDWLLLTVDWKGNKRSFLWGMTLPLYYVLFIIISVESDVNFGTGFNGPYFFTDYRRFGWFTFGQNGGIGVFYWMLIVLGIAMGIAFLLNWGKNKINRRLSHQRNDTQG